MVLSIEELWLIVFQRGLVNLYLLLLYHLKVLLLYYGSGGTRSILLIQPLNCKYITDWHNFEKIYAISSGLIQALTLLESSN